MKRRDEGRRRGKEKGVTGKEREGKRRSVPRQLIFRYTALILTRKQELE